jgi:hypothetical protein
MIAKHRSLHLPSHVRYFPIKLIWRLHDNPNMSVSPDSHLLKLSLRHARGTRRLLSGDCSRMTQQKGNARRRQNSIVREGVTGSNGERGIPRRPGLNGPFLPQREGFLFQRI